MKTSQLPNGKKLVAMWKNKIVTQALPQVIDPHTLNHILEQYYLATDTPTIDYAYSLSTLGAKEPDDLQPIPGGRYNGQPYPEGQGIDDSKITR